MENENIQWNGIHDAFRKLIETRQAYLGGLLLSAAWKLELKVVV